MTSSINLTSAEDNALANPKSGLLKAALSASPTQMKLTSSSYLSSFPNKMLSEFDMHLPHNKLDQDLPSALWPEPTRISSLDAEKHQPFAINNRMIVEANSFENMNGMKTISEFLNPPIAGGCWTPPDLDQDLVYSSSLSSAISVSSGSLPSHVSPCTEGILEGLLVEGLVGSNVHGKGVSTPAALPLTPSTLLLGLGSEKTMNFISAWSCVTGANPSSYVVNPSKSRSSSHYLESITLDPGFAERAASFPCFGGQGYSELAPALPPSDPVKMCFRSASRSNSRETVVKDLTRALSFRHSAPSSPSVGAATELQDPQLIFDKDPDRFSPLIQTTETPNQLSSAKDSSYMELSMGQQEDYLPSDTGECEIGNRGSADNSCRKKRKFGCKGKCEDTPAIMEATNISGDKDLKNGASLEESKGKRSKYQVESEECMDKMQVGPSNSANSGESAPCSVKENAKPPEPPKQDYIHVRARRGQATDSHSLAERVRREKISERMKFLQELVPGCSKVTGKAVMLDEIINYVQSLQRQVEFLSMKLASVNPRIDISLHSFDKETVQPRAATILFPPGNTSYPVHQSQQMALLPVGASFGLDATIGGNLGDLNLRTRNSTASSLDPYEEAFCQVGGYYYGAL